MRKLDKKSLQLHNQYSTITPCILLTVNFRNMLADQLITRRKILVINRVVYITFKNWKTRNGRLIRE